MNCEDMINIPELKNVMNLRAGFDGINHTVRWIYFADCLQCVKSEYRIEDYIHGSEFVVLTNRNLTDDSVKLKELISKMQEFDIAALGINEGQISDELVGYCDENKLPLFELPEKFPLVDLSQIICKRLVIEENNKNAAEQLFTSILDAEHLSRESVFAQARFLNVDLSGEFRIIEFAFAKDKSVVKSFGKSNDEKFTAAEKTNDSLAVGQTVRRIINTEFSYHMSKNILTGLQTGTVLALVPASGMDDEKLREILLRVVKRAYGECGIRLIIGVGNTTGYLEDVKKSRSEAATAIKVADISNDGEPVFFYKDQGIYTLISKINDTKFLDEFVEKNIGKLIRADEVNDSNLCETLENYIDHNCNVKYTAEYMYIHRNTLNYRLNRIQDILGDKFNDMESCLSLKLAFMIRNYRKINKIE